MQINIYTDGACKGNPGPGGYGVILEYKNSRKELNCGYKLTTNNRMELLAVIVGLESLKTTQIPVHIYSDSKYVIDSITKGWVFNWSSKGFKVKKNKDLWLRYLALHARFQLVFHWIKGHAGHPENERCDYLAVLAAEKGPWLTDTEFENNRNENNLFD
jgi:ribonuclease HI